MNEKTIIQKPSFQISLKLNLIKEFGYELTPESVILDFGCGSGKLVSEFRDLGYQAYGCCTRFSYDDDINTEDLIKNGIVRTIDPENYKLPFADNTFDFIYSQSVFEHVLNYEKSISEIARVLKPDGYCLHTFASRYRLIEPHVFVPFSTVLQSRIWLNIWTILGIRNDFSHDLNAKDAAVKFQDYLKSETNYLSRKLLISQFGSDFDDVIFCENYFNKHSPHKGKYLYSLSKIFTFVPTLYSSFFSRVILTRIPHKQSILEVSN